MGRESTSMELTREKTWIELPAYNAAETLHSTVSKIPNEFSGRIILVDDASSDSTIELASELGLWVFAHENNNQKCPPKSGKFQYNFKRIIESSIRKWRRGH